MASQIKPTTLRLVAECLNQQRYHLPKTPLHLRNPVILGCNNFNKNNTGKKTFAVSTFNQILSLSILFTLMCFEAKLQAALPMLTPATIEYFLYQV
jgi:hypothetical protein